MVAFLASVVAVRRPLFMAAQDAGRIGFAGRFRQSVGLGACGHQRRAASAFAFALGGAVTAVGGGLLSMFLTFDVSLGVVFTLKALIIVILGGVGDIRGTILARSFSVLRRPPLRP